jgi:preprotein translocase subunit SecY
MWQLVERIWKIKDLRNNILFVLGMLVIFRVVAHIPVPGVDVLALRQFLEGNQVLGLLNVFSGGTVENFSVAMMGVAPYITASIIFQLLAMVVPQLEELQKEGESGQRKISMYTRLATVPLAILQAFGLIQLFRAGGVGIFTTLTTFQFISITLVATAGTIFLMWIGELMTERRLGNGVSLLIFAGIISGTPQAVQTLLVNYTASDFYTYLMYLVLLVVTVVGVVIMSEGVRNIPVSYARQTRGGYGGASQSHLPLKINASGVIPIIFAISVLLFPQTIAQFFVNNTGMVGLAAQKVNILLANQTVYGVIYFFLIFGFTYFYTSIIFKPEKVAENLQRQGAFIPGIRPGKHTEEYIGMTMTRLVFTGALFLAVIAVMPLVVQGLTNQQNLAIGGTSMLIVVSVAIEIYKQVQAQLTMHEYDTL